MNRLALLMAGVLVAGCSSTPKNVATTDDIAALKNDHEAKMSKMSEDYDRRLRDMKSAMDKDLFDKMKDVPEMLATYQKMKNTLDDLMKLKDELTKQVAAIDAKVSTANQNLITVLEAEEKLLSDRLSEIRRTLVELKK